jgi:hypothetical protein
VERFADGLAAPEALDAAAAPCAAFGLRNEPMVWGFDTPPGLRFLTGGGLRPVGAGPRRR